MLCCAAQCACADTVLCKTVTGPHSDSYSETRVRFLRFSGGGVSEGVWGEVVKGNFIVISGLRGIVTEIQQEVKELRKKSDITYKQIL